MPVGRPPFEYDPEIGDYICGRFATEPVSLKTILADAKGIYGEDRTPGVTTVFKWLDANVEFAKNYARSKECQGDLFAEDIVEIADDGRNDWMERLAFDGANKGWEVNGEAVARSRIRIDARKWMAAHLRPKKYGDKIDIDQKTTLEASDPLVALLTQVASGGRKLVNDSDD